MSRIDYFKTQAKKLFKDYKTQSSDVDERDGSIRFSYSPTHFDIGRVFSEFDWDEENFTLMKAQHLFALMVGFKKWTDLVRASEAELELARLLWEHQHKIHLEDWRIYVAGVESDNGLCLDPESRLRVFVQVFVEGDGHRSPFGDYRLDSGP